MTTFEQYLAIDMQFPVLVERKLGVAFDVAR